MRRAPILLAALLVAITASGCRQIAMHLPDSMFCDHCACSEGDVSLWRPVTCWEGQHGPMTPLLCCPGAW